MKKLISVLLAVLMLLSSVTVVMAEATEYELLKDADVSSYALFCTNFPSVDGIANHTWFSNKLYLPAGSAVGDVGYGCLILRKTNNSNSAQYDPITLSEAINGDNIRNYELHIEFQRITGTNYVKDVEIGIGNYIAENKTADSGSNKPSVAKTINLGNAFADVANGSTTTLTVDIADLMDDGNEQKFAYNGTEPNELTAENANLIAIKSTCSKASSSKINYIQVNSVKLVKKQSSSEVEPPADETVKSIDLITHTVDGNSFFITGNPPLADENSFHFNNSTANQAGFSNTAPTVGGVYRLALGGRGGKTFESQLNGGKLEDYVIEFKVTKRSNGDVIEAIEFGLGAANTEGNTTFGQGTTYRTYSTVIRTVPFEAFSTQYLDMASGDSAYLSIPVKKIFNSGNEQTLLNENGTAAPDFDGASINEFVMQAKCTGGVAWSGVLKIDSVKLVKKSADIEYSEDEGEVKFSVCDYTSAPSFDNNKAIVAYYNDEDADGVYNLSYCDIVSLESVDANNAQVSVPLDSIYMGSEKIRAFLFNSMSDITPLTNDRTIR